MVKAHTPTSFLTSPLAAVAAPVLIDILLYRHDSRDEKRTTKYGRRLTDGLAVFRRKDASKAICRRRHDRISKHEQGNNGELNSKYIVVISSDADVEHFFRSSRKHV